jgi:putative addiction module CopG family antidote
MSVRIEVPEEIATQVRDLVESGQYPDAETAVREAFRLLREHQLRQELRARLAEAEAEIERGELLEWNEETRQRIIRDGQARYERGEKPNPDVCP